MTKARNTQAVIEVFYTGTPKARLAQATEEVFYVGTPKGRLAQAVIEVFYIDSGVTPGGAAPRFFAQVIG